MYNPFLETSDEPSDDELVSSAREGDRAALERLLMRRQRLLEPPVL